MNAAAGEFNALFSPAVSDSTKPSSEYSESLTPENNGGINVTEKDYEARLCE